MLALSCIKPLLILFASVGQKLGPPIKEETFGVSEAVDKTASNGIKAIDEAIQQSIQISFSHLQLYVDDVEDVKIYKDIETDLNEFAKLNANKKFPSVQEQTKIWQSLPKKSALATRNEEFIPQNRDVIKQLLVGFGYRVTGSRFPSSDTSTNTKSVLVTSKDESGVQIIVTARDHESEDSDKYSHFDAENVDRFYGVHANRQGIAVLGFQVKNIDQIYQRYRILHPQLLHSFKEYEGGDVKVLEVFAYYQPHESNNNNNNNAKSKQADPGTIIRFIESTKPLGSFCAVPGLKKVDATFDEASQPAYCDHWVSNVFSRTEFLSTLEDTLGFTPKVDFNAGVVAAGEAQIESTVTGNDSRFSSSDNVEALRDQSQVYLPINNALSNVGHVHGFLEELGQGIQHVASRVEDLVSFIQRCNEMREITGEGFTFLNIPRSYYGVLTADHLVSSAQITESLSNAIISICEEEGVVAIDGAVCLALTRERLGAILDDSIPGVLRTEYDSKRYAVLDAILHSRYKNLHSLLRDQVSDETYMGIVRNKILVDVQGDDILYQIFTSNILQRNRGHEAPFFEFIQRVCSECKGDDGCPKELRPGCGGFGIRNFLTLFLSIEVSKAMREANEARLCGDETRRVYAQKQVDCFTSQLNDANPILTEISDAMTEEGVCKEQMVAALALGESEVAATWKVKMEAANARKQAGNAKLMECSARYEKEMRLLRESAM